MVEILRNKWCDDLEDMLQCPVCLVCPTDALIYQCTAGHHICHHCKESPQLASCPLCRNLWTPYRNRLAEQLCSKFDDIKLSLIDPEAAINKLLIPDKLCAATQTDCTNVGAPPVPVVAAPTPVVAAPTTVIDASVHVVDALEVPKQVLDNHSGSYRCIVGSCKMETNYNNLLTHIRTKHDMHFEEVLPREDRLVFAFDWSFRCLKDMNADKVVNIIDVGAFIVKLSTDECGDLTGYVTMVRGVAVSEQFRYQLRIDDVEGNGSATYIGVVNSCRASKTVFEHNCLRLMNASNHTLKCTLNLARKFELDESMLTKAQLRRRRKKRGNVAKTAAVVG